jgi:hypothetical protein
MATAMAMAMPGSACTNDRVAGSHAVVQSCNRAAFSGA